ncbi:hypothetical protein HBB16_10450 [Pseudonocardia sp. MCCB 268]|nr:hypothetical protein [Pseudonocardia cytotoxica]
MFELRPVPRRRPRPGSVTTRITVIVTGVLAQRHGCYLGAGAGQSRDFGAHPPAGRLLLGFFSAVMPGRLVSTPRRCPHPGDMAGHRHPHAIGGAALWHGPGGTKVTTFAPGLVLWSEIRGEPGCGTSGKAVPADKQRQALAVVLPRVGITATPVLQAYDRPDPTGCCLTSALGTVGLPDWHHRHPAGTGAGRAGPVDVSWAGFAAHRRLRRAGPLRTRQRHYRCPEERTIIG